MFLLSANGFRFFGYAILGYCTANQASLLIRLSKVVAGLLITHRGVLHKSRMTKTIPVCDKQFIITITAGELYYQLQSMYRRNTSHRYTNTKPVHRCPQVSVQHLVYSWLSIRRRKMLLFSKCASFANLQTRLFNIIKETDLLDYSEANSKELYCG